jgi:hypothetical protein
MVYFACSSTATTRRMLAIVAAVSLAVALVIVGLLLSLGLSTAAAKQDVRHDVSGTVVVPFGASSDPVSCYLLLDEALAVLGGETSAPCPAGPLGGWTDVADGTEVVVTDAGGVVLASAQLTGGVAEGGTVTFTFAADDVPAADHYRFSLNARGAVERSADALARDGWKVLLDLR